MKAEQEKKLYGQRTKPSGTGISSKTGQASYSNNNARTGYSSSMIPAGAPRPSAVSHTHKSTNSSSASVCGE